jgi:hypothetical protein
MKSVVVYPSAYNWEGDALLRRRSATTFAPFSAVSQVWWRASRTG